MILMIDNYDSFTYNLVQYLGELGADMRVFRNNKVTVEEIENMNPDRIVISPGPCTPAEAGISVETVRHFAEKVPILGVCLGHQSIGAAFGGKIVRCPTLMHGKTSMIQADGKMIYQGIRKPFEAMRYHSLAVSREHFPECLEITSEADDGEVMGIRHKEHHATEGIQFHPESIMTRMGKTDFEEFFK